MALRRYGGRMLTRPRLIALLVTPLAVTALTGCSTTPVEATPAAHADTKACTTAAAHWPTKVASAQPYPVTTPSAAVRAWGSSTSNAVIARCGVDSPGPTTDACIQVDDVDWIQSQVQGGYRFVTYGRAPAIEVLIPTAASSTPGLLLPAFTSAVHTIPQGPHHCV